jgi:hypothetical protein
MIATGPSDCRQHAACLADRQPPRMSFRSPVALAAYEAGIRENRLSMRKQGLTTIQLLLEASGAVSPSPGMTGWNYGWSLMAYRRSSTAAIDGPQGVVRLSDAGLTAWEAALERLQSEQPIRARWDADELLGLLASLTAAAAESADPATFLDRNVELLRSVGPMLTIALLANVTWDGPPRVLADIVLGHAGTEFIDAVNAVAGNRVEADPRLAAEWLRQEVAMRDQSRGDHAAAERLPVAMASWTRGQGQKGRSEAERRLDDLVGLALLLESDLRQHEIYHRGPTNRPGVRGLNLDRAALDAAMQGPGSIELSYRPLSISEIYGRIETVQWFNAEPLPLGSLLEQSALRSAIEASRVEDPLAARIRVAARWFAEAHYTLADDDATLALAVALDALLSGRQALPGRTMAHRFAMLEADVTVRRARIEEHQKLYSARSSVAHGAVSSSLSDPEAITSMFDTVRWTAHRILALRARFEPTSEKEVDRLFDDLRLGIKRWTSETWANP